MRYNNQVWLKVRGRSQRIAHSFLLLLHKKVNKEPQRGMRLWASISEQLLTEPKELGHPSTWLQLFPLLSVTSQPGANVCGSLGPAFLRPPRAMSFQPLVPHWSYSTALTNLNLERDKVGSGLKLQLCPPIKISITFIRRMDRQESSGGKIRKNLLIPLSPTLQLFLNG